MYLVHQTTAEGLRGIMSDGVLKSAATTGTTNQGDGLYGEAGVDYVHEGPHADRIPEDVKAKVEALRARVIAKQIVVPSR